MGTVLVKKSARFDSPGDQLMAKMLSLMWSRIQWYFMFMDLDFLGLAKLLAMLTAHELSQVMGVGCSW